MAGTVVVDAIKSSTTGAPTFQNTSGTEIGTLCRAWVNFNGTGTVAIRASFNVSSITDDGTGDYTVNFTTAMPDANYCVTGAAQSGAGLSVVIDAANTAASPLTTSAAPIRATNDAGANIDVSTVCVAIFR